FVFIGFKPVGRYLFADHIDHDKNGYLITDQYMQTNIPGVYAVGDTRAQLAKQITTAVGDATTAVLHAERYIEELKHAEQEFPSAPKASVAEAAARADLLVFPPGATVIREGEESDRFYMVIRGEAEVARRRSDGTEEVVNRVGPAEYLGEFGILADPVRLAIVRARTLLGA